MPRSFIGPLVLAQLSRPLIALAGGLVNDQLIGSRAPPACETSTLTHAVRGTLALLSSVVLAFFTYRARLAHGATTARFYALLQLTQFHLPFYASRTLPNTFAQLFTTSAYALLLPVPGRRRQTDRVVALLLLSFAAVVLRAEVALLLAFEALQLLLTRQLPLSRILAAGVCGCGAALAATLAVDSYFWLSFTATPIFTTPVLTARTGLLWPELSAFWFNAVEGQASAWGEAPWHYYVTSALPRLLLNPAAIAALPLGASASLAPAAAFVAAYSALVAHKEWRFVAYIVPPLTLASARGAAWLWDRREKSALPALAVAASVPASALLAAAMLAVSALNYPGGAAVTRAHAHLHPGDRAHLDVATCMSGASRFLQEAPMWGGMRADGVDWDKTEDKDVLRTESFWRSMDVAVVEAPDEIIGKWDVVDSVDGFSGVKVLRPGSATLEAFKGLTLGEWRVGILFKKVWILRRGSE